MVLRLRQQCMLLCGISFFLSLSASTGYTVDDAVFVSQCFSGFENQGSSLYYPHKIVEHVAAGWNAVQQSDELFKKLKFQKRVTCSGIVGSYDTVHHIYTILDGLGCCKQMTCEEQDDHTYKFCAPISLAAIYLATGKCLQLSALKRYIEALDWNVFFDYEVKGSGSKILVEEQDVGLLFSWLYRGRMKSQLFDPVTKTLRDVVAYEGVRFTNEDSLLH